MTETPSSAMNDRPQPSDGLIGASLFAVSFAVYLYTLCPTIFADDCGEIATAVATGGVMHPPGYPLYCLIGGLFVHLIPTGEPAYRLGLFSALCAAAAAALTYLLARDIGAGRRWSAAASLAAAFSESLWQQATKCETYALNALFVVAVLMLALRYSRTGRRADLWRTALGGGFALTNHLTILWLIPAALCLIIPRAIESEGRRALGALAGAVLCCIAPLTLYGYEIIAARTHPGGQVWGNTSNLHQLFFHVTGSRYHSLFRLPTISWFYQRDILFASGWLWHNLGPLLILAIVGAWAMARTESGRRPAYALMVGIAGYLICNTLYRILNIFEYYTPAILMLAILGAYGGQAATDWLAARLPDPVVRRPLELIKAGAVVLGCMMPILANWNACDRRGVYSMRLMAENIVATVPHGSMLVVFGDNNLFPLWYIQEVLGERRDIVLVPRSFFLNQRSARERAIDGWCLTRIEREHPEVGMGRLLARAEASSAYARSGQLLWDLIGSAFARGRSVYFVSSRPGDLLSNAKGLQSIAHLPEFALVGEGLISRVVPIRRCPSDDELFAIELDAESKIRYDYVQPKLFANEPDGDIPNKVYACELVRLGRYFMDRKDYKSAHERLARAFRIDANSAPAADEYAYTSAMLGLSEDAIEGWTAATKLDPANVNYRRNLETALGKTADARVAP